MKIHIPHIPPQTWPAVVGMMALLLLAGCRKDSEQCHIGVAQCSDDAWRRQMNREMKTMAATRHDVVLHFRHAADNSARQVAQIDSFVNEGMDLIIVAPNEADTVCAAVERAEKAGIPVVVVDRQVHTPHFTAYLGGDNLKMGREAAAYFAATHPEGGTVWQVTGLGGSTPARERAQGFAEEMKHHAQFRLLPAADGGWKAETAAAQTKRLLAQGQRPDFVFAHNDPMAAAVEQVMAAHGLHPAIIGVDALDGKGLGLNLVEEGRLKASLIYPTAGDRVMDVALRILDGQPFERSQSFTTALVTKDNVNIFRQQGRQMAEREERIANLGSVLSSTLSEYHTQQLLLGLAVGAALLVMLLFAVALRAFWLKAKWNERLEKQNRLLEKQRDELAEMSRQVEEMAQSKLNFFTNVSHDFRTPLTLIAGPLEQLFEKAPPESEDHALLAIARRNVAVMQRLVSQILDVRRMESGQMALHLSRVPLREKLGEWTSGFLPMAKAHDIELLTDFSHLALPEDTLWLDEEKLERICFNLLSNAFKFTPRGGHICLSASTATDSIGRLLTLRLSDSGRGMSPEEAAHVFDRFYQCDDLNGGSGIGLTVAQGFARLHGGTVRAESDGPGCGTTFVATLYEQPAPADGLEHTAGTGAMHINPLEIMPSETEASQPAPGEAKKPLLLVIDDNEDIRNYLRAMLARDFRVTTAADGAEGLKATQSERPDIVVCDMMMPVMDGLSCLKAIRADAEVGCTPVVMLTACALDAERVAGYEGGADAYVAKPFSCAVLRARLLSLLEGRRRFRALLAAGTGLPESVAVPEEDKDFALRLRRLIEAHLSESDYNVEQLACGMALSRAQLYRRVKQLSGDSPVEILRKARLTRARDLLAAGAAPGEVAYATGFSSPSYFSKCFREEYGFTPSEVGAKA